MRLTHIAQLVALAGVALLRTSGVAQNTFPATGNVGIGTTSPYNILELAADYNGTSDGWTADPHQGQLTVHGVTNPNLAFGIGVDTTNDVARLQGQVIGTGPLPISINPNGGNVGISTVSPTNRLTITADYNGTTNGWASDPGMGQLTLHGATNTNLTMGMAIDTTNGVGMLQAANVGTSAISLAINSKGGNVGIGTTSPGATLEVNGNVKLSAGSGASVTFADGTVQSTAWTGALCGGDYAESVQVADARPRYEPGDVLVVDPRSPGKFQKSAASYSTLVAGVFSTKPGLVGRRQTMPKDKDEIPMAMIGIVPTKVSAENGAVRPGDLLVTSTKPGYAMKGTDRKRLTGAILGKALGSVETGAGVIEVLVTLQ